MPTIVQTEGAGLIGLKTFCREVGLPYHRMWRRVRADPTFPPVIQFTKGGALCVRRDEAAAWLAGKVVPRAAATK